LPAAGLCGFRFEPGQHQPARKPVAVLIRPWQQRILFIFTALNRLADVSMRHIISILMANEAGALVRVAGMFSQRGFNIETLNVAPTQNASVSRLTLVTEGTEQIVTQINRQLLKLVDVIEVRDMTGDAHLQRELALLKVRAEADADSEDNSAVSRVAREYGARMVSAVDGIHTLEYVGTAEQIDALVAALDEPGQLEEEVRTGAVAITPGTQGMRYIEPTQK